MQTCLGEPHGTMLAMGTIAARYDRSAASYDRWWAPVLRPAVTGLLDTVDAALDGQVPTRVLDIGAGTGTLARSAVTRWPNANVVGLDGSAAMLEMAAGEAGRTLMPAAAARLSWATGLAQALPFAGGSFELVLSSFVMQLVPDRGAALREAFRVLRPGGLIGYVTWLEGGEPFQPDAIFDELVDEDALDDAVEAEEARSGDLPSAASAAAQARRAGFRTVTARGGTLEHRWTARSYLSFLERYDAADLFDSLAPDVRRRLRERTKERFAGLPAAAFTWRAPIVSVIGRRPG
jgi:ubiquinone/menaquinone biosynthesis C-methylase UbiE